MVNEIKLDMLKTCINNDITDCLEDTFPDIVNHQDCMKIYENVFDKMDYKNLVDIKVCSVCSIYTPCLSKPKLSIMEISLKDKTKEIQYLLCNMEKLKTHDLPPNLPKLERYIFYIP